MPHPRTVLVCHADDPLNREGLARWLAATTDLVGIIEIEESPRRLWRRILREIRRVGVLRFLDVLAFRFFYALLLSRRDRRWESDTLRCLCERFPAIGDTTRVLRVASPNLPMVEAFLVELRPDITIARCKTLLKEAVFSIPRKGTFVMHPGICPQYRNAHGCFWALAQEDHGNVGMTLIQVDTGIDTGPVHGFFRCAFDEVTETHVVIQHKVVLHNLDELDTTLKLIYRGKSQVIDTCGAASREWGQPWLSSFILYRWRAFLRRARGVRKAVA